MLWSYSTPIEAFKLKTYNLNEFLEDRLSIFLFFDCVFNSWFLYSMSPLTWNLLSLEIINQFSFPRPLSTAEMRGITKFLQSEKTGIKDNVLAGCKPESLFSSHKLGWRSQDDWRSFICLVEIMKWYMITTITSAMVVSTARTETNLESCAWISVPQMTILSGLILF